VVEASEVQRTVTFRVQRALTLIDVPVLVNAASEPVVHGQATVEALRRLARLGRDVSYLAYSESAGRPGQYVARLTLGFKPVPATPAPTTDSE
jgi:hypothetical protein